MSVLSSQIFLLNFLISAYLELVLAGLGSRAGVEKVNGENLGESSVSIDGLSILWFSPAARPDAIAFPRHRPSACFKVVADIPIIPSMNVGSRFWQNPIRMVRIGDGDDAGDAMATRSVMTIREAFVGCACRGGRCIKTGRGSAAYHLD